MSSSGPGQRWTRAVGRFSRMPVPPPRAPLPRALIVAVPVAVIALVGPVILLRDGGPDGAPREGAAPRPPVRLSPAGDELERLAPILIAFDVPPRVDDPSALVSIAPAAEGTFVWLDASKLMFQPAYPGLRRGEEYTLRVLGSALGLPSDVEHRYRVSGELKIVNSIPADGDQEVPLETQVLVQFSRSVAPLTTLEAASGEPLIEFSPLLTGRGEWLNTSLYRFLPSDLEAGTTYTATIAAGVAAATDAVLPAPHTWRFTTIGPALVASDPPDLARMARADRPVTLTFNQPMLPSTADHVRVVDEASGPIAVSASWREGDRVLVLTPRTPLQLDTNYRIEVPSGLPSANGPATAASRTLSFKTLASPRVVGTDPFNGATNAQRFSIRLEFNQPVDLDSVHSRLSVSGLEVPRNRMFSSQPRDRTGVPTGNETVSINVPLEPSTEYEVVLAAGAVDQAGLPIAPHSFRFTTGRLEASLTLASPGGYATFSSRSVPEMFVRATNYREAPSSCFNWNARRRTASLIPSHSSSRLRARLFGNGLSRCPPRRTASTW